MKKLQNYILGFLSVVSSNAFAQGGPPPPPGLPIDDHINLLYFAAIFAVLFFIFKLRSKGHTK